jgi:hypothetical protein
MRKGSMLLSLNEALDEAPQTYWLYEYNRFVGTPYRMVECDGLIADFDMNPYDLIRAAIVAAENATVRQFPDLFVAFHRSQQYPNAFYYYLCHRNDDN